MTTKIIVLAIFFIANLLGLFALLSNFFNLPFKAFFGYRSKKTGNKKVYYIGHIILVLLIFYLWIELTGSPINLILVSALIISSILSLLAPKIFRKTYRNFRVFYIAETIKLAFVYNLMAIYVLGLLFKQIDFIVW